MPTSSVLAQSNLLENTVSNVLRVCDVGFGATSVGLAALSIWLLTVGRVEAPIVLALWSLPLINTVWSALTRRRNRVTSDVIRGFVCLPITVFIYTAEAGIFEKLWIPALLQPVSVAIAIGIASRRSVLGYLVTFAYAGALFGAAYLQFGGYDFEVLHDAVGIGLTGSVISLIASRLGRTLAEAGRQRDTAREQRTRAESVLQQLTQRSCELTTAIESLHSEMEHRMRIEVELHQAQKLESIGRLAAGVAHEINTPVQFVRDSVQFVRDGIVDLFEVVNKLEVVQRSVLDGAPSQDAAAVAADATDTADLPYLLENVPKALDRALEGLGRVTTIVRSMKEFAHPDSKEMTFVDLNHAIETTLTIAHHEYCGVAELVTDFGEIPPVRCHAGELNQALLNIIVNAAHAVGDVVRGTDAKGLIRVRTSREGDDVVIAIADSGTGISESNQALIFDPFFTTKAVGSGTGQGLAITRSVIVDKHHGRLDFETVLGKGTTFFIRLAIEGFHSVREADAA